MNLNIKLTAVFQEAVEGGYVAFIEEIPGTNTQGETLDEARANLSEALQMVLEANKAVAAISSESSYAIKEEMLLAS